MFRYMIYWVTDPGLKHFDPQTDLLVSQTDYLVWRHVNQNQDLLRASKPYCGALHQRRSWMIMPITPMRDLLEVHRWLDEQLLRAPSPNLGINGRSQFYGLLRPLSEEGSYADYNQSFALVNAFIRTYLPGCEELDYETPFNPEMAWEEDRQKFTRLLRDNARCGRCGETYPNSLKDCSHCLQEELDASRSR